MTMVLCNLAFLICKYFDFPDLSLRLREILKGGHRFRFGTSNVARFLR